MNHVVLVEYILVHGIEQQVVKELSICALYDLLKALIYKCVERMAVRGVLRTLSGLSFEIVYSIGQENFTFVRKKSGNFRNLCLWQP